MSYFTIQLNIFKLIVKLIEMFYFSFCNNFHSSTIASNLLSCHLGGECLCICHTVLSHVCTSQLGRSRVHCTCQSSRWHRVKREYPSPVRRSSVRSTLHLASLMLCCDIECKIFFWLHLPWVTYYKIFNLMYSITSQKFF